MHIRAMIVDDEPLAIRGIHDLLEGEADIEIAGEATSGAEAIEAIRKLKPDLIFLDVQMPEGGGFDALEALDSVGRPIVVFVTAYDEYAVQAFDALAFDYLLKPVDPDRFRRSLERVRARIRQARAAELQAVTESKARLTRGFSHDVKNLLGAADGYLTLAEEGIPKPITRGQKTFVEKARRSVAGALNLIEDLLEIERATTDNIRVERRPTDLYEVVQEAADEHRAQAEAKGLDIELNLAAVSPVIATDPTRVRQVLGNMISNAVKYTPSGTVSIRMDRRMDPDTPGAGEHFVIEVEDTGIGIPEEKRHLVFQEFMRFEPGMAQGIGIGLAISYRLAQALGGVLRLESTSGGGSKFALWLPVTSAEHGSRGIDSVASGEG